MTKESKWYYNDWFIALMFCLWFAYGIPAIVGIILIVSKNKKRRNEESIQQTIINNLQFKINELTAMQSEESLTRLISSINEKEQELEKINKTIYSQSGKLSKIRELYCRAEHAISNFTNTEWRFEDCKLPQIDLDEMELISPSIMLKLHCMDIKDLRKSYRDNEKQITQILQLYSARYTTKANKSIYDLMVIALRAELQNILYGLKYEKLEKGIENVKHISAKYLSIAADGNQSIAPTLTKFIGEMEYLFICAVKIEYNYYVKKEQTKQEQLAIREQMRQEAEERKALETERKKIDKEEEKYNLEISKLQEQMQNSSNTEIEKFKLRILELQSQLSEVTIKKEEIIKLQNGKAGNIYVISNLGSFGENIFKIGMTRRLDPQERVNELGDASVPFRFDVHSFIFSNDAVSLEAKLHARLDKQRVNKVNLRKEFFYSTLDELEAIVNEIDPSAEFNKTMLAEQYRQSISSDANYTNDFVYEDEEDE